MSRSSITIGEQTIGAVDELADGRFVALDVAGALLGEFDNKSAAGMKVLAAHIDRGTGATVVGAGVTVRRPRRRGFFRALNDNEAKHG